MEPLKLETNVMMPKVSPCVTEEVLYFDGQVYVTVPRQHHLHVLVQCSSLIAAESHFSSW